MSKSENPSSVSLMKLRNAPSVLSRREDGVPAVWDVDDVILDLYEVKEVFWPGATGLVYRVHHREWNIDLAVKTPRETPFETEEQSDNFVRAAAAWVGLGLFPHIVSCYYVRALGGIPRLFLEFVGGGSLQDWIQTRRLYEGGAGESLERILDISIQFAWGLQYAHEQGLIHHDVKPGNLLLTADGVAKLKGFTSARAPQESIAGNTTAPDVQPDIASWAASVLEMFAGEWRWGEQEISEVTLQNYLEGNAQGDELPQMPAAVSALLRQCLQRDASQRPAGMGAVAATLREVYKQQTGSDHPRRFPVHVNTRAEALNNRALSLLDLGQLDEALRVWEEALIVKPHQAEATYNRGLTLWRVGRLNDVELVRTLEGLKHAETDVGLIYYLLSLVHLERDDSQAAAEALRSIKGDYSDNSREIDAALTLAQEREFQSVRPLQAFCDEEIVGPTLFSPDGQSLLLTVSGHRIMVLELAKPHAPRYLAGHTSGILAITLSANGRYALSSSEDETVRLWDVVTAECLQTIAYDQWPRPDHLGLSADGRYAVFGFDWLPDDSTLRLWDVREGHWIRDFETLTADGPPLFVSSVCMSPDGAHVLSGSDCGQLYLWDVNTGKAIRNLEGLSNYVKFVQFSPDGTRCFAANGHEVREFDIHNGEFLSTTILDEPNDSKGSHIVVSADGNFALFGSTFGELKLWEISTGRCLRTFQDLTKEIRHVFGGSYEQITSINLSADGRYSLAGTKGGSYKLWRFNGEYHAPMVLSRVIATEEALENQIAVERHLALARAALAENRFDDAAPTIRAARAVPGYERFPEAVQLWTSLYGHLPRTRLNGSWLSHVIEYPDMASSTNLSADGQYVLFGGFDMELREIATDKCVRLFPGTLRGNAALSGDARLAMIGGWERYELWDTVSGKLINKIYSGHEKHVKDIQVSLDGKCAVSCTEARLDLWEITAEGLRYLSSMITDWGELSAVALSSDNKYCVSGTGFSAYHDYVLRLWEIPAGQCVRTFKGYDSGTYAVVFSPDNKYVLGGGFDHKLRLWEVASGECVRLFEGHTQPVDAVDISADGKYALSGGRDYALKLWEVATGRCIRTWELEAQFIAPVRFSSDCKYILSGTADGIRVELLDWELAL